MDDQEQYQNDSQTVLIQHPENIPELHTGQPLQIAWKKVALSPYWALFGWIPGLNKATKDSPDVVILDGATNFLKSWWAVIFWPITIVLISIAYIFIALIPLFMLIRLTSRLKQLGVPFHIPVALATVALVSAVVYGVYSVIASNSHLAMMSLALLGQGLIPTIFVILLICSLAVPVVLSLSYLAVKIRA